MNEAGSQKTTGATKNYKNGRKNGWRRWVHNQLGKRVEDKKNATVLYLAGKEDIDRAGLIRKGFRSDNLIAVEKEKSVVNELKKKRKLVIHGKLEEVLFAWPDHSGFDVLIADMCSGLSPMTIDVLTGALFCGAVKNGGTVMVNVKRGQADGRNFPAVLQYQELVEHYTGVTAKHRGRIAFMMVVELLKNRLECARYGGVSPETRSAQFVHLLDTVSDSFRPKFNSYRSGGSVYYDSLVFSKHFSMNTELADVIDQRHLDGALGRRIEKIKRQISAVLAEQTKRKSGQREHSPNF